MKYQNNTLNNSCLESVVETDRDNTMEDDNLSSTPKKQKERRSISLLDISEMSPIQKTLISGSAETLGSTSSICKDSGFHQSECSLVSEKTKNDGFDFDFRLEYFRLLDNLKFKDVMISSLHESNHNLRMKMAEAENKISELKFNLSHCKCCMSRGSGHQLLVKTPNKTNPSLRYSVSTYTKSEPCLLIASPLLKTESTTPNHLSVSLEEPSSLPSEDAFSKVKQWQSSVENVKESHIRYASQSSMSPGTSTHVEQLNVPKICVRPPPEPLPKTMSYMETSRALAETYRRKQEKSSDIISFQVIGDHSVSVAPVQYLRGSPSSTYNNFGGGYEKCNSTLNKGSPKERTDILPGKQDILNNLIRNQKNSSSSLLECLRQASEYSASLTSGISQLPAAFDQIRSISKK